MNTVIDIRNRRSSGILREIFVYDVVSGKGQGVSSKEITDQIAKFNSRDAVNVRINSPGGSVFEGLAIYNALRRHPGKVIVDIDAQALSIASVIAMAGDEIRIANNAWVMVHQPWSNQGGTADQLRREADLIDGVEEKLIAIYISRTGQSIDSIETMMAKETWMNAQRAKDLGFADTITENSAIAAMVDLKRFKHPPREFVTRVNTKTGLPNRPRLDALRPKLARIKRVTREIKSGRYGLDC